MAPPTSSTNDIETSLIVLSSLVSKIHSGDKFNLHFYNVCWFLDMIMSRKSELIFKGKLVTVGFYDMSFMDDLLKTLRY